MKAAFKSVDVLLPAKISPLMLSWGEGYDPDSLYAEKGAGALKVCVDKARDLFEVMLDHLMKEYDPRSADGRSRIAHIMVENIAKTPDSITRSSYCQLVAEKLGLSADSLYSELNFKKRRQQKRNERGQNQNFRQGGSQQAAPQRQQGSPFSRAQAGPQPQFPPQQDGPPMREAPGPMVDSPFQDIPPDYQAMPQNAPQQQQAPQQSQFEEIIPEELHLLDLAVSHEEIAHQLADELPVERLSQTPVGQALNHVLSLTLLGDWGSAASTVAEDAQKSTAIAKMLIQPEYPPDTPEGTLKKALEDCLKALKEKQLQHRLNEIMTLMRDPSQDPIALLQEYQQLKNQS